MGLQMDLPRPSQNQMHNELSGMEVNLSLHAKEVCNGEIKQSTEFLRTKSALHGSARFHINPTKRSIQTKEIKRTLCFFWSCVIKEVCFRKLFFRHLYFCNGAGDLGTTRAQAQANHIRCHMNENLTCEGGGGGGPDRTLTKTQLN